MSKIIHLTFLISLFLIFLLSPTDPDLGWHLRCGEEIWQGQGFCGQNHFTVLLENYSWPNHAWGYQAIIYPIFKFFGFYGLTIFNALLMTAAFWFLFATVKNHTLEKMLGILATIYFGWGVFSFGIRSQLLGFFFFNLTLFLLTKWQEKPRLALLLPLVTLVWANTHGSVILGLILIGVTHFSNVVRNARFSSEARGSYSYATACKRVNSPQSVVVVISSALATLVNPFGFRIYEEAWRHFSGPIDLSQLIAEWVPPQPHIQQIILISGAVVLVYLVYRAFVETHCNASLPYIFLIPIFAFWGLKARRNVPFFFVVLSYSFLNSLKTKISPLRNQLAALLAVGVLLYGLLVQLPQTIETNSSWENFCQKSSAGAPCAAVEFLKEQEAGNIFNRYEWGGFLIWQLPEYKIFVDGRMPAWPASARPSRDGEIVSPYTIYLETLQTQPGWGVKSRPSDGTTPLPRDSAKQNFTGWQETLDQYNITYILISPNTFMDLLLAPNPASFGWQELFRNKLSVVYFRQRRKQGTQ